MGVSRSIMLQNLCSLNLAIILNFMLISFIDFAKSAKTSKETIITTCFHTVLCCGSLNIKMLKNFETYFQNEHSAIR